MANVLTIKDCALVCQDLGICGNLTVQGTHTTLNTTVTATSTETEDNLTIVSTDAGSAAAPDLKLYRNSVSPADGDDVGHIKFSGNDSAGNETIYGGILGCVQCATSTTECGMLKFNVVCNGTIIQPGRIEQNGIWSFKNYYISGSGSLRNYGSCLNLSTGGGAYDITFQPSSVEKMRLTSGGNLSVCSSVTIGLASPDDGDLGLNDPKLHVQGSTNSGAFHLVQRLQAGGDANDTGAALLINHSNDRGLLIEAGRGGAGLEPDDRAVMHLGLVNSGGTNARFMTAREGGNVGIGTTAPANRLHISQDNNSEYSPTGDPYNNAIVQIRNTNTTASIPASLIHFRLDKNGGDGYLGFITDGSTSNVEHFVLGTQTGNEMLRINKDGNVGIGTTSPDAGRRLHVKTTGTVPLMVESTTTTAHINYKNSQGSSFLSFENSDWNFSSGNVGIGTTAPSAKLDVNGDVIFRHDSNSPAGYAAGTDLAVFGSHNSTGTLFEVFTQGDISRFKILGSGATIVNGALTVTGATTASTCLQSPIVCGTTCVETPKLCAASGTYYLNLNAGILNVPTQYTNCIHNSSSTAVMRFTSGYTQACTCIESPIVCATSCVHTDSYICGAQIKASSWVWAGSYMQSDIQYARSQATSLCLITGNTANNAWCINMKFSPGDVPVAYAYGSLCGAVCVKSPIVCATSCVNFGACSTSYITSDGDYMKLQNAHGYISIGPGNYNWSHFYTNRPGYYFNTCINVDSGVVRSHNEDLFLTSQASATAALRIATGTTTSCQQTLVCTCLQSPIVCGTTCVKAPTLCATAGAIIGDAASQGTTLCVVAQNTAGSPATATAIWLKGYEGRGIGTFFGDVTYAGQEWFTGMNYAGGFGSWNVGYDASCGQAEYGANTKFRVASSGTITSYAVHTVCTCLQSPVVCATTSVCSPTVCATGYLCGILAGNLIAGTGSTCTHGAITITGSKDGYGGIYSCGWTWMTNVGSTGVSGIYDSSGSQWGMYTRRGCETRLMYNGSDRLLTTANGTCTVGVHFATTCVESPIVCSAVICSTGKIRGTNLYIPATGSCTYTGDNAIKIFNPHGGYETTWVDSGNGQSANLQWRAKTQSGSEFTWMSRSGGDAYQGMPKFLCGVYACNCLQSPIVCASTCVQTACVKIGQVCLHNYTDTRLRMCGTGDNSLEIGPSNDNGWMYFMSTNNSSGIYFYTNQGAFQFDDAHLRGYNDGEVDIGVSGGRFRCGYFSHTVTSYCLNATHCAVSPIFCASNCVQASTALCSNNCVHATRIDAYGSAGSAGSCCGGGAIRFFSDDNVLVGKLGNEGAPYGGYRTSFAGCTPAGAALQLQGIDSTLITSNRDATKILGIFCSCGTVCLPQGILKIGSHVLCHQPSTGDLEIKSAGGDLDITTWLRMRCASNSTVKGGWHNASGRMCIGGDAPQSGPMLQVNGEACFNGGICVNGNVMPLTNNTKCLGLSDKFWLCGYIYNMTGSTVKASSASWVAVCASSGGVYAATCVTAGANLCAQSKTYYGACSTAYINANNDYLAHRNQYGNIMIGPGNASWGHILTDRSKFYFSSPLIANGGEIGSYDEDLNLVRANGGANAERIQITSGTTKSCQNFAVCGVLTTSTCVQSPIVCATTKVRTSRINDNCWIGSNSVSMTCSAWTTGVTVCLNAHEGGFLRVVIAGDWNSHSAIGYMAEFFIQDGGNGYSQPGSVIREVTNQHNSDYITARICDPGAASTPRQYLIQFQTVVPGSNTTANGVAYYDFTGRAQGVS